jgi:hypothetical protein
VRTDQETLIVHMTTNALLGICRPAPQRATSRGGPAVGFAAAVEVLVETYQMPRNLDVPRGIETRTPIQQSQVRLLYDATAWSAFQRHWKAGVASR